MEKSTNPIKTEKVVLGIFDLKIVTKSDVRGGGSAKVTKSDKRGGRG